MNPPSPALDSDLERATEKLARHAFPITLEPLEPMDDEKTLSRDEARAVVDALTELDRLRAELRTVNAMRGEWRA